MFLRPKGPVLTIAEYAKLPMGTQLSEAGAEHFLNSTVVENIQYFQEMVKISQKEGFTQKQEINHLFQWKVRLEKF